MEIPIQPEHAGQLARMQHVLEWLQAEQARLLAELAHIGKQGQQAHDQLAEVLRAAYGIDLVPGVTLDTEKGTITTPDSSPEQQPEPPFLKRAPESSESSAVSEDAKGVAGS